MGFAQLTDGELHYDLTGPENAPVLVLSNSLGTDLGMWDAQIPAFSKYFRVLRLDTRGHGKSLVTKGPYTIEQLGHDVLALFNRLNIQKAHFCGLSMGGLIGQWLAIHANDRLHKLVLCNTAAKIASPEVWNPRIEMVLRDGLSGLREGTVTRWFTPEYVAAHPQEVERLTGMLLNTSPEGYAANCAAVRDADFRKQLGDITAPTLVICGTQDPVTTIVDGQFLHNHITGSEFSEFHAAHLSSVELGEVFTLRVLAFLLS